MIEQLLTEILDELRAMRVNQGLTAAGVSAFKDLGKTPSAPVDIPAAMSLSIAAIAQPTPTITPSAPVVAPSAPVVAPTREELGKQLLGLATKSRKLAVEALMAVSVNQFKDVAEKDYTSLAAEIAKRLV